MAIGDRPPEPPNHPNPSGPPLPVRFVVEFDQLTGDIAVTGPVQNRLLAYGVLALAFEAVLKLGLKAGEVEGGRVVVPRGFRGQ